MNINGSELPSGWTSASLGDLCGTSEQRSPEPDSQFFYIDIGSIDRSTKTISATQHILGRDAPSRARKVVRKGDVLVSMTRPNLNSVAIVPAELDGQFASTGLEVLRPENGIDSRWIWYAVRTNEFVEAMSNLVQGALYPAIRPRDVRRFVIPVPPASEQKRIADKLDSLLSKAQKSADYLKNLPDLLAKFRESVLEQATSSLSVDGIIATSPAVTMASILSEPMRNGRSVRDGDGLPVLRLSAITSSGINYGECKTGDWSEVNDIDRFLIKNGDFLISRGNGSKNLVGRGALVEGCSQDLAFPDTMIRIRADRSLIDPEYLKIIWDSQLIRRQVEKFAKTTTGIWKVSQSDLEAITVPLPSLSEQATIVLKVASYLSASAQVEAKRTAAEKLVSRMVPMTIARAFRGELVNQDPSEASATILLSKINSARIDSAGRNLPRPKRAASIPRAPKESASMTKSRQDDDVMGRPYLASLLKKIGKPTTAEDLFKSSQLSISDFYKQLAWEIDGRHIKDNISTLETGNAP